MKIEAITIKNFKVFRDLSVILDGKSVVLFGVNGVGKSTVLSAINYIFRVFLNQMNPVQSKAFEKFQDDMVRVGSDGLEISAIVKLTDNHLLVRKYKPAAKNDRNTEHTYPRTNYSL